MGAVEIIIIIAAGLIVIGTVIGAVVRKKKGKPSCDCGCSPSSGCASCPYSRNAESENTEDK